MFKALVLEERNGQVTSTVRDLDDSALPAGNVSVAVEFTTINYKDGLIINGGAGLVKRWPHVPGIDFAGTVRESKHPDYEPGDKVVLTGWRVGETHWGGHAQRASALLQGGEGFGIAAGELAGWERANFFAPPGP